MEDEIKNKKQSKTSSSDSVKLIDLKKLTNNNQNEKGLWYLTFSNKIIVRMRFWK